MAKWLPLLAAVAATAVIAVLLGLLVPAVPDRLGVVLMHGKLGTPTDPRSGLSAIAANLESSGHLVALPEMPWAESRWEHVDVDVPVALATIDGLVASLKAQGASRIVVGGHSLGANVALAYATTRANVAGLVMAAPGHHPGFMSRDDATVRAAILKARDLVKSGQGQQPFVGPDNIQGSSLTLRTTAEVYLSWMDPEGLAAMDVQARRLSPSIPVLLVISRKDPFHDLAEAVVYKPASRHPYSRYLTIGADHSTTPMAASTVILEWMKAVPSR